MTGYYGQFESNDNATTSGIHSIPPAEGPDSVMQLALVVKVVTTPTKTHSAGTIQFRPLQDGSVIDAPNKHLQYARPVNQLFVTVPVIGEYVYIINGPHGTSNRPDQLGKDVCRHFYMTPISIRGDINHNVSSDNWNVLLSHSPMEGDAENYESNSDTPPPDTDEDIRKSLGNDFHRNSTYEEGVESTLVMSPTIFEGDVLLNGRFGQSIRMSTTISEGASETWRGTANLELDPPYLKPITIIRNGLPEGTEDRYVDNLETDPSAIYLTNGQFIPELKNLTPFGNSRGMDIGELFEHGNLGAGVNQCIIRADRIMSIARREIYAWSELGISLATRGTVSIDAGPLCIIDGSQINLGTGAGSNTDDRDLTYAVRGEQLQRVLLEIINAFSTTTVVAGGVTGNLIPLPSLSQMYSDIVDGQETGLFSKKVFLE